MLAHQRASGVATYKFITQQHAFKSRSGYKPDSRALCNSIPVGVYTAWVSSTPGVLQRQSIYGALTN